MGHRLPLQCAIWINDSDYQEQLTSKCSVIVPISRTEDRLSPTLIELPTEKKVLGFHANVRLSAHMAGGFGGSSDKEAVDWSSVERLLTERVEWCAYSGVRVLIVNPTEQIPENYHIQFARMLLRASLKSQDCEIVLRCRFLTEWRLWYTIKQLSVCLQGVQTAANKGIKRVCVSLDAHYPNCADEVFNRVAGRWLGEEVAMLLCTTSSFKNNLQSMPSMVKRNRELVEMFLRRDIFVALEAPCTRTETSSTSQICSSSAADSSSSTAAFDSVPHMVSDEMDYIDKVLLWLQYTHQQLPPLLPTEISRGNHHDYLQEPLQPLADNLTAYTYSVFEEDRIKYDLYRAAIKEQLSRLLATILNRSPAQHGPDGTSNCAVEPSKTTGVTQSGLTVGCAGENSDSLDRADVTFHVAYLGGGRGPLMQECFDALKSLGWRRQEGGHVFSWIDSDERAADDLGRKVKFLFSIVEKNPCAAVVLRHRVAEDASEWWRDVEVLEMDMREWMPREPVNLVISELLGSVGDNELSPECLWPAYRAMDPVYSAIVPLEHTSYFIPIAAAKIHRQLAAESETEGAFDMGYVVDLYNYTNVAEPAQAAFRFSYGFGHLATNAGNDLNDPKTEGHDPDSIAEYKCADQFNRFAKLRWTIQSYGEASELHGFAGYFSSLLSPSVTCSIAPHDGTRDMDSWYPLYLPIEHSVRLEDGDALELHIWRACDSARVWYEWLVQVQRGERIHYISRIHNWSGTFWNFRK